jgi:hypothetical protein
VENSLRVILNFALIIADSYIIEITNRVKEATENDTSHTKKLSEDDPQE